jgi:MFS family permease
MTGLVTAIYDIGCAIGAVCAFIFGERLGRKRSIILAQCIGTVTSTCTLALHSTDSVGSYRWSVDPDCIVQLCTNVSSTSES